MKENYLLYHILVQEGHDLRAGTDSVGAEGSLGRTADDAVLHGPLHCVVVVAFAYIGKAVDGRSIHGHKAGLDVHLAGGHGEGVLGVALLGHSRLVGFCAAVLLGVDNEHLIHLRIICNKAAGQLEVDGHLGVFIRGKLLSAFHDHGVLTHDISRAQRGHIGVILGCQQVVFGGNLHVQLFFGFGCGVPASHIL